MVSRLPFCKVPINHYFYPLFPNMIKKEDKTKTLLLCNSCIYVIKQPLIQFWLIAKVIFEYLNPAPSAVESKPFMRLRGRMG